MRTEFIVRVSAIVAVGALFSACQTGSTQSTMTETPTAELAIVDGNDPASGQTALTSEQSPMESEAAVQLATASPAQLGSCQTPLAGGPPPKPARGKDFGQAVAKNTGKTIQRGIIQNIGARLGGGLGGAIAGGVANSQIRNEENIKGVWTLTDGVSGCACDVKIDSPFKLVGKGNDTGTAKVEGCSNPTLAATAQWALGYSFAGYDAKFELKAADKKTVLATLNRDGIHYFSGTLPDGTPITMWREGQNYTKLRQ